MVRSGARHLLFYSKHDVPEHGARFPQATDHGFFRLTLKSLRVK